MNGRRNLALVFWTAMVITTANATETGQSQSRVNKNFHDVAGADAVHPLGVGAEKAAAMAECRDVDAAAKWGICVHGIRLSAAGYMLDYRFKVVDAVKAAPLLDRNNKPKLTVEKDGAILAIPTSSKIGALRQSTRDVKEGRTYFMFFANPGRRVASGDLVTVSIGGFTAEHLRVD